MKFPDKYQALVIMQPHTQKRKEFYEYMENRFPNVSFLKTYCEKVGYYDSCPIVYKCPCCRRKNYISREKAVHEVQEDHVYHKCYKCNSRDSFAEDCFVLLYTDQPRKNSKTKWSFVHRHNTFIILFNKKHKNQEILIPFDHFYIDYESSWSKKEFCEQINKKLQNDVA